MLLEIPYESLAESWWIYAHSLANMRNYGYSGNIERDMEIRDARLNGNTRGNT